MTAGKRVGPIDNSVLSELLGHNCRRAYSVLLEHVVPRMSAYDLSPRSFSVLVLLQHNPGLSGGQVCRAIGMRSSNLVAVIAGLKEQGLIEQRPHPTDKRVLGIHLTPEGRRVAARAHRDVQQGELSATSVLSDREREQLNALLARIHAKAPRARSAAA